MGLSSDHLRGMISAISRALTAQRDTLNHLDSALGDGDHGTGISAGFEAAAEAVQAADSPSDVLRIAATTLMNRMGGSSGALYGTLFLRASAQVKDQAIVTADSFAAMWQAGADGVAQRGKAQPGDKTMLDALVPAVDALRHSVDEGLNLGDALASATAAAQQGAQATAAMQARQGRARYVGDRSVGHVDAGAQSMALMFQAMNDYWKENGDGEA
jgi:dihydroxyacetone kinase-like protein